MGNCRGGPKGGGKSRINRPNAERLRKLAGLPVYIDVVARQLK